MTEEQLKKAKILDNKIDELLCFIKNIEYLKACLLYGYCYFDNKDDILIPPKSIRGIFERHDEMIRQEINEEIQKLKDEIKTL